MDKSWFLLKLLQFIALTIKFNKEREQAFSNSIFLFDPQHPKNAKKITNLALHLQLHSSKLRLFVSIEFAIEHEYSLKYKVVSHIYLSFYVATLSRQLLDKNRDTSHCTLYPSVYRLMPFHSSKLNCWRIVSLQVCDFWHYNIIVVEITSLELEIPFEGELDPEATGQGVVSTSN